MTARAFRIVGGALRGRRFGRRPPAGTRPTSERVREALASALQARGWLEGAIVVEPFAGTGALSFECLSRGASHALLIDENRQLVRAVRKDAEALGLAERVATVPLRWPASTETLRRRLVPHLPEPATLLLLDPPYDRTQLLPGVLASLHGASLLASRCALAVEYAAAHPLPALPPLADRRSLRHGDTALLLGILETT